MKDELSSKIIEWLGNIGNIVSEELPLFVKEVATYGFWSNLCLMIANLLIVIAGIFMCKFFWKEFKSFKGASYDINGYIFGVIGGGIVILIFVCCSMDCMKESIKAKTAPKLYVIERFTK